MDNYIDFNRDRWNRVALKKGNPYTIPVTSEELARAKDRPIEVALTVRRQFQKNGLKAPGNKILRLACGGDRALFAAKGYDTTIMDYSEPA